MLVRAVKALLIAICSSALVAVVFVAAVFLSESPQLWTSLILAAICFLAMRRSRTGLMRMLWWNCGAIFGLWALFEGGALLWMGHSTGPIVPRATLAMRLARFVPGQLNTDDPILGYRLAPGAHEQEGDVVYNINSDGLRAGPTPSSGIDVQGCVLFFGCSYTFGEGVSDDQTFPYLVQVKTGGRFQSRNFGVSGSAPHYALAQVESGIVEHAARCAPTHAIYMVLPHHLVRVAGKFAVRFGPKYAVQPNGELIRNGSLNRTKSEFLFDMLRYTSALYVAKYGHDTAPADDRDIRLVVAVLRSLRQRLLDRYPGIHFDILYWDDEPTAIATELGNQLSAVGVPVHNVSRILPQIQRPESRAYLRVNHHPSPWAHEKIAEYIVRYILVS